jgi:hypothetical protein
LEQLVCTFLSRDLQEHHEAFLLEVEVAFPAFQEVGAVEVPLAFLAWVEEVVLQATVVGAEHLAGEVVGEVEVILAEEVVEVVAVEEAHSPMQVTLRLVMVLVEQLANFALQALFLILAFISGARPSGA